MLPPRVRARLAVRIREARLGHRRRRRLESAKSTALNIRVATALAMRRAIRSLLRRRSGRLPAIAILIDGLPLPEVGYPHDALVDGDALCQSIAAAAILAKTVRDRLMQRLAGRYPVYGWETNVGYGTPEHQEGISLHGPTPHHRLTFAPLAQLPLAL